MGRHLASIGQFARTVRLSVKALRRYDAEGLLKPAVIDPDTGYRYYASEQSRTAVAIAMLRRLEVPLSAIRALLEPSRDDPEGMRSLLQAQKQRLEREIASKQAALASVQRLLLEGELFPHEVRWVIEPTRRVATLNFETTAESMEADTTEAVRMVVAALERDDLRFVEPIGCSMFEPDEQGRRNLTVHVGLPKGTPTETRLRVETLPGGPCASTRHVGSYLELGLAHFALHAFARERGRTPTGPVREFYINDPDEVPAEQLITDLMLPLEGDEKETP